VDTFNVTILGCSSATPAFGRNPTSQIVQIAGSYLLLDCGEATQIQLRKYSIKFQRIDHIFISHLHGDHFLGLPGLLSSMHLLGRKEPLHLYAEEGLKNILDTTHHYSRTTLQYPIIFHPLDMNKETEILRESKFTVRTLKMKHSIPCCGFLIEELPRPLRLIKEKIEEYSIPIVQMEAIKGGADFKTNNGKMIANNELTLPAIPARKYAYCADTIYNEEIIPSIENADLLYHEATFTEEMKERAKQTMHCTAKDAATIALKAKARKLIIGHFSARYKDLNPLLEEAKLVFPNTFLAEEGTKFEVDFKIPA